MKYNIRLLFLAIVALQFKVLCAQTITFDSGIEQTTLLELYTSEGCSSCPPADHWLSRLKNDQRLWKQIVPVAFHVDYWNYLGWQDQYSQVEYSQRQRHYVANAFATTVYTPGFFANGREWRGWFSRSPFSFGSASAIGRLSIIVRNNTILANFDPLTTNNSVLKLNLVTLGIGLTSQIRSGENAGKTLTHDFVVLALQSITSTALANSYQWRLDNSKLTSDIGQAQALAAWITTLDDPTPIQAVGGWLR